MFPSPKEQRQKTRRELSQEVRDIKTEKEELRQRREEENSIWNKAYEDAWRRELQIENEPEFFTIRGEKVRAFFSRTAPEEDT